MGVARLEKVEIEEIEESLWRGLDAFYGFKHFVYHLAAD
jgi:hypothetical protein